MSSRKVEMIFELVDRATRPMRQLMRLQRQMGRTARDGGRDSARGAGMGERAQRAYSRAVDAAARAQAGLKRGIGRTNRSIEAQIAGLRRSGGMMGRGFTNIAGGVAIATAAFAGFSAAAGGAAAAIVGPAAEFEKYAIQLETLEGSSAKGQKAMAWIENFAATTPLELNEVVQAFTQMRSFGLDPTNGSMTALLDTMSASGKGYDMLQTQVLALGKAQTIGKLQGESVMMLMERGVPVYDILAKKLGKTTEQIVKMQSAGKLGRDEIALLIEGMGEMNAGASEKISKTWDGIISNLMDQWTRFRRMIADAGVFDYMKFRLRGFLDWANAAFESGQMQVWAERIADGIMTGFKAIEAFAVWLYGAWGRVLPMIDRAADAMGGYRNLALAVAAIALHGTLLRTAWGLFQIGAGAAMAVRYLAGLSFAGLANGALRFGSGLIGLLNPVKLVRGAMIALRFAVISTGIGAVLVGIAMAGIWIYENWAGLKEFFIGVGEGMGLAFGPVPGWIGGILDAGSALVGWVSNLFAPVDANAETWRAWGVTVGKTISDAIAYVADLPSQIAGFFGAIPGIDWISRFGAQKFQGEWSRVSAIASGATNLWTHIKALNWQNLIGDPRKSLQNAVDWIGREADQVWSTFAVLNWSELIGSPKAAWDTAFGLWKKTAVDLWAFLLPINWTRLLGGLRDAWDRAVGWLKSISWTAILPSFNWSDIIPDGPDFSSWFKSNPMEQLEKKATGGIMFPTFDEGLAVVERLQTGAIGAAEAIAQLEAAGAANGGEWQSRAQELAQLVRESAGIKPPVIADVPSLEAASNAADALSDRLPNLEGAAQKALDAVRNAYQGIEAASQGVDLTAHGVRIGQSLADGLRSQIELVRAAALDMGAAIRTSLPSAANAKASVSGPTIAGARATGGPVQAGLTYLVGERGPEFFTAPASGQIINHARTAEIMGSVPAAANQPTPPMLPNVFSMVSSAGKARNAPLSAPVAEPRARPTRQATAPETAGSMTVSFNPTYDIRSDDVAGVRREIEASQQDMKKWLLEQLDRAENLKKRKRMA